MPIHGLGNAPLQTHTPSSTPSTGSTDSGRTVQQQPAQEKRGIFSIFQRAQAAPSTKAGNDSAVQIPVSKPITARTVFSSFANIKMLATTGYTATTQALKREQCIKELGSLKEQRVGMVASKTGEQEIRKLDDAIGERSKSISAKDWLNIFGTDSSGLLMSMPKNTPMRQDFVVFNANYRTPETILFLQAANDPANMTREGMNQLFNKFVCADSPYQVNVSGKLVASATEQLFAMEAQGDTSASNFKTILAPAIEEMERLVNKDPLVVFGKKLEGKYDMTETFTPAEALKQFDAQAAERPVKDLLAPQFQKLEAHFETIRLRDDPKVPVDLFEGNSKLKTASKESLFGDNAAVDIKGLDDAAHALAPTPACTGDAGQVASHPILSQMGKAMAQRSVGALSNRPGELLVDFAKTLAAASASQKAPQSLAELQSGNVKGQWTNYVDTVVGSNPGRAAEAALIDLRTELLGAKRDMLREDKPVVGGALDNMIAIVEQRLSGAPAPSAAPAGAHMDAPREAVVPGYDPLRAPETQRQWMDSMGGKEMVKLQDILNLPAQHPMRISLREGMAAHFQGDSFKFLETLRNEPQMDLSRARQVVEQQLGDVNLPTTVRNPLVSSLGGIVTMVKTPDPNSGIADFVPTLTWKPADTVAASMPAGGWVKVFDPAENEITALLATSNLSAVLNDPSYFP